MSLSEFLPDEFNWQLSEKLKRVQYRGMKFVHPDDEHLNEDGPGPIVEVLQCWNKELNLSELQLIGRYGNRIFVRYLNGYGWSIIDGGMLVRLKVADETEFLNVLSTAT